jgi:transposase
MANHFVGCERGQLLLMPRWLAEWLPDDHLVWTVLGAVGVMDLERFCAGYQLGGAGRAAYDPAMLVALLLYAYARGNRSSRAIERECWEDVAYKVITTMRTPDHSTIAEFRKRHEAEIGELFEDVLDLCREAGLVSVGVIAIDGTKIKANASINANRTYWQVVSDILREAEEIDRLEDELYGDARGDELPEQLRTAEGRKQALAQAKQRLAERKARTAEQEHDDGQSASVDLDLDPERFVTRSWGRRNWLREARHELERQREREQRRVPRDRDERLLEAARRLEENLRVEIAANDAYERWRSEGTTRYRNSRRSPGGATNPYVPPELPEGRINTSDPDSRVMRTQRQPLVQGYNAQAAVNENQIIIAAEVNVDPPDFGHLEPMLNAVRRELANVGIDQPPRLSSPTPGTGTRPRCSASPKPGSSCSCLPTAANGKAPGRAGKTASTSKCATSSQPTTANSSTNSARSRSSRCSGRSNSTAGSTDSYEEAEPRPSRSGD